MSEVEDNNSGRIKLDTVTLENRSAALPETMRELFIWLGSYLRDECASNPDILQKRFEAIDIEHDKTTWTRILRGLWDRDEHGKERNAPILSEEKFIRAVTSLRKDARFKAQGGRIAFVKTGTAKLIIDYIDIKRMPDRVNKFGVVIGETGSQKNATTDFYCAENNHGMCIAMEAPHKPSMPQFIADLAKKFGYTGAPSYGKRMAFILEAVTAKKTIIIHNVQRLYDERFGENQPIFSFLQKLQEDTNCTIIITITPVFEKKFVANAFFEQFEGRAGGRRAFLRLPSYPPEEDVRDIAKAFGFTAATLNEKTTWAAVNSNEPDRKVTVLEYLCLIAKERGRIRRLFEDLQDAKIQASAESKPITIHHVKEARGE